MQFSTPQPAVERAGKRKASTKTSDTNISLPDFFKELKPTTKTKDAMPYFRMFLGLLNLTTSSKGTYTSCVNNWVKMYASNEILKRSLHPDYIKLTEGKSESSSLKRAYPMNRCGLGHFTRMYELCCHQFYPHLKQNMYEKGAKINNRRQKIIIEDHLTLEQQKMNEWIRAFILDFETIPKSADEAVVYLKNFGEFVHRKKNEMVWSLSGVSTLQLRANTEKI